MERPAAAMAITALLLLALSSVANVDAFGINCQGSALCSGRGNAMVTLRDGINRDVDPNRQYSDGQQIACTDSNICAFVQNFGGTVSGSKFGPLLQDLVDHHCGTCGSVPLDFPNSNDVSQGELTVNFVSNPCFRQAASVLCD